MTTPEQPSAETFGHEPIKGLSLNALDDTICGRCTERGVFWGNATEIRSVGVTWPCTSAIVLGLAPRTTTPAPAAG